MRLANMRPDVKFSSLPEAYHLHKVDWQVFGDATVRYRCCPGRILRKIIATIRQVCRLYSRKHAKQIMLFYRFEHKEGAESPHAHFVTAGLPEKYDPEYFAADFKRLWQSRNGDCQVEPYEPAKGDGVGYTTKSSGTDEDRDLATP